MRLLILLLLTSALCINGKAQFQQISVNNNSGELLNILREQIRNDHADPPPPAVALFATGAVRQQFTIDYQNQLLKALTDSCLSVDVLLLADKAKLAAYCDAALTRFASVSGGKYVDQLLAPALANSLLLYAKDDIVSTLALPVNLPKMNGAAVNALSILKAGGYDYHGKTSADIIAKLEQYKNSLPFDKLNDIVFGTIENQCNNLIKNAPATIVFNTSRRLQKDLTNQLNDIRGTATDAVKTSFNLLGKSMQVLSDNEKNVDQVIGNLQQDIKGWQIQIDQQERDMYQDARVNFIDPVKQAAHAQLVAQALYATNVLNTYIKEGTNIISHLDEYKTTAAKLFSGDYLKNLNKQLETLKEPTLSGVVTLATNTADAVGQIGGALAKFGILNPAAAASVSKFVNGAKVALGVAAALLPPNPLGILGALGGLGGLFGGGPSQEVQLEQQILQEMEQGFNQLNQRLDAIENHLQQLDKEIQAAYTGIMKSLQLITDQLTTIEQKIDLGNEMSKFLIYQDYNLVNTMIQNDIPDAIGLDHYSRWYNNDQTNDKTLNTLNTFIESRDNLAQVIRADFTNPTLNPNQKSYLAVAGQEITAFNTTLALFLKFNPDIKTNNSRQNLLEVPARKNTSDAVLKGKEIVKSDNLFDFDQATGSYFNSILLMQITNQYLKLHPFFLLSKKNSSTYNPVATLQEFVDNQATIADKFEPSRKRLHNLIIYLDYCIIQQCLLAGHTMMSDLTTALFKDFTYQNESLTALKNNELLRKNLCIYLLNAMTDEARKDSLYSWLSSAATDNSKVQSLNTLLIYGAGRLKFSLSSNPNDHSLYLIYTAPGSNDAILSMLVPDASIVKNRDMVYDDNLYGLLDCKQRVVDALLDMNFFQNLPQDQQTKYKTIFFNQTSNQ